MSSFSSFAQIEACQTEPVATPLPPELSAYSINTDVRKHGFNPFFTGVTLGIIVFITGFLLVFAHLVVTYLQYTNG